MVCFVCWMTCDERGYCSFVVYLWNCWPSSLFKLPFHNRSDNNVEHEKISQSLTDWAWTYYVLNTGTFYSVELFHFKCYFFFLLETSVSRYLYCNKFQCVLWDQIVCLYILKSVFIHLYRVTSLHNNSPNITHI